MKPVWLLGVLVAMAIPSLSPLGGRASAANGIVARRQGDATNPVDALARDPEVVKALNWIGKNAGWVTEQQIKLTEIPAPKFGEEAKSAAYQRMLQAAGLKVRTDGVGNAIGEREGADGDQVILLAAHLDTVFPEGTPAKVTRKGSRLLGPGIADNGAGLSALLGVAMALNNSKVKTGMTIVFAGDVGEEGEGNLRGVRTLVQEYGKRLQAVIAVDGAAVDYVATQALASKRMEIIITGPGGHSWTDFGAPNPITALSRAIVQFSTSVEMPITPRSSFNFGVIDGGTSVNSIPNRVTVKVDFRSEDEAEIGRLEAALREAVRAGVAAEMAAAKRGTESLQAHYKVIGTRPGGKLAADSALMKAINDTDEYLGNSSHMQRSSTDANIPLSLGIPAISIGGGGLAGGAHSLEEWYDPENRDLGMKRILLAVLEIAGVKK